MNALLLEHWSDIAVENGNLTVLPDGCRDLVFRHAPGQAPGWHASALMTRPQRVCFVAGERFEGYRFRPGCLIDELALQRCLAIVNGDRDDVDTLIAESVTCDTSTPEMMAALESSVQCLSDVAASLGVSVRSFQRHLKQSTGQSATFWLSLLRARRAARLLASERPLPDVALDSGYSDQSHMTREFRRWFDKTPAAMRTRPETLRALLTTGYD